MPEIRHLLHRKALILAKNVLYSLKMSKTQQPEPLPCGERIFSGRFRGMVN
jgi:hypothetical protein